MTGGNAIYMIELTNARKGFEKLKMRDHMKDARVGRIAFKKKCQQILISPTHLRLGHVPLCFRFRGQWICQISHAIDSSATSYPLI
jgi:hypothetical protein